MIIQHPGLEILKVISEMGMTQKELATRAGVSEKHICTVVSGSRPISTSFAKKLGYVIKDATYWLQAQAAYDVAQQALLEKDNITEEEIEIYKELKEVIDTLEEKKLFKKSTSIAETIVDLRSFFQVGNLSFIKKITYNAAYRAQISKNVAVKQTVMYAWMTYCEKIAETISCKKELDIEKLKASVLEIKKLMFKDYNEFIPLLQKIFSSCGIAFAVVKNFKGAPVQGFIKESTDKVIMCLTNRRKRADTFWFTLFHEIGHILNGDIKTRFVDFENVDSDTESKADEFARNTLIHPEDYKFFVQSNNEITERRINRFAKSIGVAPFIIVGRLQKDQIIDWAEFTNLIEKYKQND